MKKALAEFIGTFILVFFGCGTAMLVGTSDVGYLITALAFGLAIVVIAYSVGNISGGHVNPAVSLAMLLRGDITLQEFIAYVIAQVCGAFVASGALMLIWDLGELNDKTGGLGSNGMLNDSVVATFLVEMILTFLFVLVILGVTSKNQSHGSFGGLVIGLSLTVVHLFGIGLTGTSVNPARSLAPALLSENLSGLWIFIVAPMVGAALAYYCYKFLETEQK